MQHLYIFYFFTTFSVGLLSLGIAAFTYAKTKVTLLAYYLLFYVVFTFVVVVNAASLYLKVNTSIPQNFPLFGLLTYTQTSSVYALMFVLPVFLHYLCGVPNIRRKNWILAGITILTFLGFHIFVFVLTTPTWQYIGDTYIQDPIILGMLAYAFGSGLYYGRKIQEPVRKKLAVQIVIMLGLFLPGIANDAFLDNISPIKVYPLLYTAFSILFTAHLLKYYLHPADTRAVAKTHRDEFFSQYNISAREQDVLLLLVQGLSNQNIGETLFISPNTVKTHIRNIYAKLGVSSRYELLALIQDIDLSPASENS